MMRVVKTMQDARRMRIGEVARGRMPLRAVREEGYHCRSCRFIFSAPRHPEFCPGCGRKWARLTSRSAQGESE